MKKNKSIIGKIIITLIVFVFALSFILPTFLTFMNSFMSEQEISSNYGVILICMLMKAPVMKKAEKE